jgi:hypothetical protein
MFISIGKFSFFDYSKKIFFSIFSFNNGICIDFQNHYHCICRLIYQENNYEILQDKYIRIQCVNNGRNLTCICSKKYHDDNCELIIDYCQSQSVRKLD